MVRVLFKDEKKVVVELTKTKVCIVNERGITLRLKTKDGWETKNFDFKDLLLMNNVINQITIHKSKQLQRARKKIKKLKEEKLEELYVDPMPERANC
jgi:hypothetical protein